MKTIAQALQGLEKAINNIPPKAVAALDTLAKLNPTKVNRIMDEVAEGLTPTARTIMRRTLADSGIERKSGDLQRAAVDTLQVMRGKKGFRVAFGSGFPQSVYIRGSVFRYGAVKGVGVFGLKKRERRKVKKVASKVAVGGTTYLPPKPPFYKMSTSDKNVLKHRQEQLLREVMRRKGVY